jgi:hypothetical protein
MGVLQGLGGLSKAPVYWPPEARGQISGVLWDLGEEG